MHLKDTIQMKSYPYVVFVLDQFHHHVGINVDKLPHVGNTSWCSSVMKVSSVYLITSS